jgi:PAS domain S-box-containing protein
VVYLLVAALCAALGNAVRREQRRAEKNAELAFQRHDRLEQEAAQRHRVQDELRESNEQLQRVLAELQATYSQSPVGMLQLDKELRYVRVNEAMAAINGIPVEAHFGKTVRDVVPQLADEIEAACRDVIETGKPVLNHELSGETGADPGVEHTWLESWFPLRNASGEVIGLNVVAQDITERKKAEVAQRQLNEMLEERVGERTAALAESEQRTRRLASLLTMAEQEERRRISQVLHDDLQQQLYAIQLKLHATCDDLAAGETSTALEDTVEAEYWLRESIETTRRLTVDLSPPILKSEGLADALGWLVTQMGEMHNLSVELVAPHPFRMPDDDMRVLLFQIVRELLFNVVKHAGADRATIELSSAEDRLVIHVSDNGQGFDVAQILAKGEQQGGLGLFNARERLRLFSGDIQVESMPGKGTRVTVFVPTYLEEPLPPGAWQSDPADRPA